MTTSGLNSLAHASSSYLRSARHQPVRWQEWGEAAFELAKRDNKPILLDIGAVWCHWCHVMDRESYEDPEIAEIVNQRFVAIKVDRDERPDIDARYQVAVQAISGQGGWPLTAFLTPEGKPFYGGTYFPPQDYYGRPSFRRVLVSIAEAYREKHGDVVEQSHLVEGAMAQSESFAGQAGDFSPQLIEEILDSSLTMFDEANGGFGSAPKFPHSSILDLVIDRYVRGGDERLRKVFTVTLEKMARGGVYDQLAGGFHRYSVDERWVVPHFEKMSYDNSELLKNYVHAFQATGADLFREVASGIIGWMDECLSDRKHGGFYASQDADYSMNDDGDYFTWTVDEARAALGEEEAEVACLHYDINEIGEMHHNPAKNVLYQRAPVAEIGARLKLSRGHVEEVLRAAKQKMRAARAKRPTPAVDKTVYVSWNALAISAYLVAARAMNLDEARRFALRSLDRILAEGWKGETGLRHVLAYSEGQSTQAIMEGFLDDYAFTTIACLDAYETTADLTYFRVARKILDQMIERFHDPAVGGFFDSQPREASLGVLGTARKPFQDSPTPAGNAMAAIALLRMYGYTDENAYREKGRQTLDLAARVAGRYGLFAGTYGIAGIYCSRPLTQVVVVGGDETACELYRCAVSSPRFGTSALRLTASQAVEANLPPTLRTTIPHLPTVAAARTSAVVCSGFACKPPAESVQQLQELLADEQPAA
ncbi:MAG: thioredoxin domain-containing protein [Acidobacteria bacterium]|nr:thioredoxin domain-containing protein [Acidobacteriota bacterium]